MKSISEPGQIAGQFVRSCCCLSVRSMYRNIIDSGIQNLTQVSPCFSCPGCVLTASCALQAMLLLQLMKLCPGVLSAPDTSPHIQGVYSQST